MRLITDEERITLKRITETQVRAAGGPTVMQLSTRVNGSSLTRYGSDAAEHVRNFMAIDVAVEVDRMAKRPGVTEEMARMLGFRLVPLEADDAVTPEDSHRILSRLFRKVGALAECVDDAEQDGRWDALETRDAEDKIALIARALIALDRRIHARAGV